MSKKTLAELDAANVRFVETLLKGYEAGNFTRDQIVNTIAQEISSAELATQDLRDSLSGYEADHYNRQIGDF